MIHIILFSIIVVAYISRKQQKLQSIAFMLLALMASVRYMYGNDYSSYYRCYEQIKHGINNPFEDELLYTVLNKITPSFYVLIIVTSVFFIYIIYKFIEKNIEYKYIWIAIFVFLINPYLFLMNLSAIRQCIAMCFFIFAIECAIKKRFLGYVVFFIIAVLFHKSSIILAPVILFVNEKKVNIKKILIILVGMFLILNYKGLIVVINNIMRRLDFTSYYSYIGNGEGNSLRATILSSIYFIYVLFNLPKLEGKYLVYGKVYLLGTIFGILAYRISMFTRIQMYFDIFSVVVIPYLFTRKPMNGKLTVYVKRQKTIYEALNRYILPCIIILIYCLRYYSFFNNSIWEAFYKYKTILDLL